MMVKNKSSYTWSEDTAVVAVWGRGGAAERAEAGGISGTAVDEV